MKLFERESKDVNHLAGELRVSQKITGLVKSVREGRSPPQSAEENKDEQSFYSSARSAIYQVRDGYRAGILEAVERVISVVPRMRDLKTIYANWYLASREVQRRYVNAIRQVSRKLEEAKSALDMYQKGNGINRPPIIANKRPLLIGSIVVGICEAIVNGLLIFSSGDHSGGILAGIGFASTVAVLNSFGGAVLAMYVRPMREPYNNNSWVVRFFGSLIMSATAVVILAANVSFSVFRSGSAGVSIYSQLSNPTNLGVTFFGLLIAVTFYAKWSSKVEPVRELESLGQQVIVQTELLEELPELARTELYELNSQFCKNISLLVIDEASEVSLARKKCHEAKSLLEEFENEKEKEAERYANVVDFYRARLIKALNPSPKYLNTPCDLGSMIEEIQIPDGEVVQYVKHLEDEFDSLLEVSTETEVMIHEESNNILKLLSDEYAKGINIELFEE